MHSIRAAWRVLTSFLNPEDSGSGGLNGIHYAILCAFLALVVVLQSYGGAVEGSLSGFWVQGRYTPSAADLHLTGVTWWVHSPYQWDSGVLGTQAVDDIDAGLGYGRSVPLRLPGPKNAFYSYIGSGWIPGSGGYLVVRTHTSGRLAFFHLQRWFWTTTMHGGQTVGQTGWPTDPEFAGGGPAGPQDAHECIAPDAKGLQWLEFDMFHQPPLNHFPTKIWNQYRVERHLPLVPHKDKSGHLRYFAKLWWKANYKSAGGVTREEEWLPKDKAMKEFTQGFSAYWWPAHPSYGVHWVKRKAWKR